MRLTHLLGLGFATTALFAAGCDSGTTNTTQDMAATPADMAVAPDLATAPDMAMAKMYGPTLLLQDVSTIVPVPMGDAGVQPVPVRMLAPIVVNNDPALIKHDFDNRDQLGLGCFADAYDLANGKKPLADIDMGTVTISGYTQPLTAIDGKTMVPGEINCALDGTTMTYKCGYGPLQGGKPGFDVMSVFFAANAKPIAPDAVINYKYSGAGPLGTYDSGMAVKAKDTLTVTDDLTKIKYSAAADTVINFTCPDMGGCGFTAVLVQLVGTSVAAGMQNYPGAQFGNIYCTGLASGNKITINKEAVAAGFKSMNLVQVMTRVVRGTLPPNGQKDSKGNVVTVAAGRGTFAFAPR